MTDEQEIARIMELRAQGLNAEQIGKELFFSCLLYTSDAADE